MYRVGMPLWKVAARFGVPLKLRVHVHFDQETQSYWADSPDLDGLVVAGETLPEVQREVRIAADEILLQAVHGYRHRAVASMSLGNQKICPT